MKLVFVRIDLDMLLWTNSKLSQSGDSNAMESELLHLYGFEGSFLRWIRTGVCEDGFELRHMRTCSMESKVGNAPMDSKLKACADGFEAWLLLMDTNQCPIDGVEARVLFMDSTQCSSDRFESAFSHGFDPSLFHPSSISDNSSI